MKRFKSFWGLFLCVTLVMSMLLGCGSTQSEVKKPTSVDGGNADSNDADSNKDKDDNNDSDDNNADSGNAVELSIEEQVLYDANDIKITATGIHESIWGVEIDLVIENNSDTDITVQDRDANVNGFMVSTTMSVDVASGKKAKDSLIIDNSSIKECGLIQIATIEFRFHIFDADTWDDIALSDVITITTSQAEGYTQAYDDSGDVLVDYKGIKIICKGLSDEDSFWGPGVILYIENNSNQGVTIQVRDVSVNGFMIDPTISEDVIPGKKAMSAIQFYSSQLEENDIDKIEDIEFYFTIIDLDTWDDVLDSDIITLHFD